MKLTDFEELETALSPFATPQGTTTLDPTTRQNLATKYKIDPTEVDGFAREVAQIKKLSYLRQAVRKQLGLVK
ncbi:hypothetical protein [Thiothrix winogradskyi]|uniref:Uncharacterized protein n=1 Tax=Thiothrix winogradskyi TaxID=96472 RepID=A0ABY3T2Q7_9GAMM|nr:hypothetical protein [Thiothrix winogradskyi]UJS24788.1 hypothetical protein L2Y54_01760 [Thiothrix winogradskyi]